ncbi:MAG TPA: sulfotransferase [Caulobacteraceae bacterium]|jgi:Flp pilus assembly protein TadD|nr:sulfotransferase [Caulobacteraceae bacterium]
MATADLADLLQQARQLSTPGSYAEALKLYDQALAVQPALARALIGAGHCLTAIGRVEEARRRFEAALVAAPQSVEALGGLAMLLVRAGAAAQAREFAERALERAPDDVQSGAAVAAADVAERRFAEAEARLRTLIPRASGEGWRATLLNLLGDALDGLGRPSEAWPAYVEAKTAMVRAQAARMAPIAEATRASIERLTGWLETLQPSGWMDPSRYPPDPRDGAVGHAFLVGYPRSGTTLLEYVLGAHPRVLTLEERPTLVEAEQALLHADGALPRLATLSEAEVVRHRAAYWQAVRRWGGDVRGRFVVDKSPFNSLALPLIARLFPDARVLLSVRDPRDVVLSCCRRLFAPNGLTYLMLTPEGAAALYSTAMWVARTSRDKLKLALREARYETLVDDLEGEARQILTFLGLDWDPRVADFAHATGERLIGTASGSQVKRGLYRGGEGQWRAYREALAPVMPVLEPWVRAFGYPAD